MPNWRDGLVEAFPIPEDRRPGYRKKKPRPSVANKNIASTTTDPALLAATLAALNIDTPPDADDEPPLPSHNPAKNFTAPFAFFSLPAELRNRIYTLVLFTSPPYRHANGQRPGSRLSSLLVNSRMHAEASYILYTVPTFRIFSLQLFDALPTLLDLAPRYQQLVTNLSIVLGPSWTNPPKDWRVTARLKRVLKSLEQVKTLRVFVELDPTHPVIAKFRFARGGEAYVEYCAGLVKDVVGCLGGVEVVEMDGYEGVEEDGRFVTRLREVVGKMDVELKYGKVGRWGQKASSAKS